MALFHLSRRDCPTDGECLLRQSLASQALIFLGPAFSPKSNSQEVRQTSERPMDTSWNPQAGLALASQAVLSGTSTDSGAEPCFWISSEIQVISHSKCPSHAAKNPSLIIKMVSSRLTSNAHFYQLIIEKKNQNSPDYGKMGIMLRMYVKKRASWPCGLLLQFTSEVGCAQRPNFGSTNGIRVSSQANPNTFVMSGYSDSA